MNIHILGICGTFMGGVAQLAVASGHKVTGCDANVYPPMSDQLCAAGVDVIEGYDARQLALPDIFVIGNAVSRGNPLLEAILNQGLPYVSGPQWLAEHVLHGRKTPDRLALHYSLSHVLLVAAPHLSNTIYRFHPKT